MNGQVFATIAALCLLVIGILGWQQFNQQEVQKADLRELRAAAANAESRLERKRNDAASAQERLSIGQAILDSEKEKKNLTEEIAQLQSAKTEAHRKVTDLVHDVQTATEGLDWPDVSLPNGQVITSVKIQKVNNDLITLSHSGGVVKVNAKDLPDDLKERLGFNLSSQ
jgi:hypothetical protein